MFAAALAALPPSGLAPLIILSVRRVARIVSALLLADLMSVDGGFFRGACCVPTRNASSAFPDSSLVLALAACVTWIDGRPSIRVLDFFRISQCRIVVFWYCVLLCLGRLSRAPHRTSPACQNSPFALDEVLDCCCAELFAAEGLVAASALVCANVVRRVSVFPASSAD